MSVRYVKFDGKACSVEWAAFLGSARRDGVQFSCNSLRRNMGEQGVLYAQNMYPDGTRRPNRPLTAKPSTTAPHIRVGRWDHAGDLEGTDALIAYAASKGVRLVRTVRGESWHLEFQGVSSAQILAKFGQEDPYDVLDEDDERLVKELAAIRSGAGRRGKWLESEKKRANSIKRNYLRKKIGALKAKRNPTARERKRLGFLRDAVAGRKLA